MSERLTLFQETLQTTGAWLREIAEHLGTGDEHRAYHLLRATLGALRDRLLPDDAVGLAAQLPVLIRGLYYEDWRITAGPLPVHTRHEFLRLVAVRWRPVPAHELESGVRAVLAVLSRNIDFGETFAVLRALPDDLRDLFPEHMVRAAAEADQRSLAADGKHPPLH